VSGFACGLLTAWLTLSLLASSDRPVFVRSKPMSVTPAEAPHATLTLYYSPRLGPAPNPPGDGLQSDSRTPEGTDTDVARRLETLVRELTTRLGSEASLEPIALPFHGGPGSDDGGVASLKATQEDHQAMDLDRTSSRRWPTARYLPLSITPGPGGSAGERTSNYVAGDYAGAWRIVFAKDTPPEQGMAKVRSALITLQRDRAAAVADRVTRLAELKRQLQDLQTRFPQEMETLRHEWRERQTEFSRLAMSAIQNQVVRGQLANDPLLAQLQATRESLLKRRQQLLMTHTVEHPDVKAVESLLAEVEQEIQLRSRRQKEYSANGVPGETNVPAATTWLSLPLGGQIGAPSAYEAPAIGNSHERPGLASNNQGEMQRLAALQSEIQSWDAKLGKGLDELRGNLEELQGQFVAVEAQLRDALTDWEVAQGCVVDFDRESLSSVPREVTKTLTPFSLLFALLVGLLAHGAVTSLIIGFADGQRVSTAEQLFAITGGPVFHINLSTGDGKFIDGMDSVSPPHFATTQVESELSSKPRV